MVLLVVGVATAGLWWMLRTDDGRDWLRATVEDLVNGGDVGLTLRVGSLDGDLPTALVLRDVTLADAGGPWLGAERLTLAWDPWALLDGRLHVTDLGARALWVERAPVLPPTPDEENPGDPLDPALLGLLRLDRLAVEGAYLGAGLTGGEAILLDAEGRVGPPETGDGLAATLALRRIDGPPTEAALTARLHGDALDRLALDLTARDGGPDGTLAVLADLPGDNPWALTLTGDGTLADWTASLTAGASDWGDVAGSVSLGLADPATTSAALDLTVTPGKATPPDVRTLLAGPLTVVARGALDVETLALTLETLRLANDTGASLEATAALDLAPAPAGTASAHLRLDDLARLKPFLGDLSPAGSADLRLTDIVLSADGPLTGDLRLALSGAALGIAPADAVLGSAPTLAGHVAFDPASGLAARDLDLRGAGLTLTGRAALPATFDSVDAHVDATLEDLALVAGDAAQGALRLAADLSGPLADPGATISARMSEATVAGQLWTDVALDADLSALATGATGRLSLTGTGPGGAVAVALSPSLPGYARAEVPDLEVTAPGLTLTGRLATDLATTLTDGDLSLRVDDAATLAAWGAPALNGSLAATVTLARTDEGRQQVALRATAPRLTLPDADLRLGALDLSARVDDALGSPRLDASATATDGDTAGVTWERLALTATGAPDDLGVTVDLTGSGPTGPLTLATRARIAPPGLSAGPGRVTLTTLDLDSGGHRLRLTAPATVSLETAGGARVDRLALRVDDGTLSLAGGLSGTGALDLTIEGRALPLTLADLAGPDAGGLSGRLDLTATLSGALPTPTGSLDLAARDVALADAPDVPPLDATVTGRLDGGRLRAEARLAGFAATPARASADVPLRLGGPAVIPPDEPLSARLDWAGPLGPVWEMLPLIDHRLSGDLTARAALAGTLAAARVDADVRLTDGRYEHLTAGTLLDDLTVTAAATGSERIQVALSGTDGGTGRLSGEGDVRVTEDGLVGTVAMRLNDARVVRRDDVKATADADLTLSLEGDRAALTGTIVSRDVRVNLANLSGGAGGSSADLGPVVEVDDPSLDPLAALDQAAIERAKAETEAPAEDAGAFPVALDITVRLPNKVYVAGRGLDSEWSGTLAVGGTAAAPRLNGTISTRRGTIETIGKTFAIETGDIRFTGGVPIDPLIDLVALYQTSDLEARVGLTGPASDPDLVLSSVPALPQDEVLARILFDKTSGQLTTLETVQLASALSQLTGLSGAGASDITGVLRRATNLDVLRVGGDLEGGAAALEAGTYVSEDVYVGVEQGLDPGGGSVSVEVDLGAGFALESRAARSGEAEVGVQWQLDY
ncbi:translocation/assembly module TamB domain-containing protein [Roseospira visakhapatnamensis]|uniref:Translocation and assembly module TamB n=1 Tax=Roseospira visakhapatnamensis TaxID=390880 RepID=A0A7W6RC65_9PROT|nr:translocation and assembly module TamB [Roseospira visakhapatnamensis]